MLPKKDAPNGLYLYCNTHKRWYKNDNVVKCNCDLKYKAKVHIPGTKRNSKIKTFEAVNLESAIQEFQEFKKTMKNNDFQDVVIRDLSQVPIMLLDCMAEYLDFKKDIDVPYHNRHNLTKKTLRQIEYALELFCISLQCNGIEPEHLKFDSLDNNDKLSGMFTEYLVTKVQTRAKTYNNHLVYVKGFVNYMIRKHYSNLRNPFDDVKYKKVIVTPKAIDLEDFYDLLQLVNEENGKYIDKSKKQRKKGLVEYTFNRSYFKPWLVDAFLLGLFTGGRKEETGAMKCKHIIHDREGRMSYILVTDLKATRLQNLDEKVEGVIEKYVEIVPELESLLYTMGYEEKKGTSEYVLANDEKMSREHLMNFVSKAFSHYYKKLNLNENLNWKHLRKTYFTEHAIISGIEKASKLGGHRSARITLKHYIDNRMVIIANRKKYLDDNNEKDNEN